jgi:hypothetical protein
VKCGDLIACVWPDGECAGEDTGLLIDGVSGTAPRRETTELVERRVDKGTGGLDEDADRWTAFRIANEVDCPLGNVDFPWLETLPWPSTRE